MSASKLSNEKLANVLRAIGKDQETAILSFTEDGSCLEYLIEAANRLMRPRRDPDEAHDGGRLG